MIEPGVAEGMKRRGGTEARIGIFKNVFLGQSSQGTQLCGTAAGLWLGGAGPQPLGAGAATRSASPPTGSLGLGKIYSLRGSGRAVEEPQGRSTQKLRQKPAPAAEETNIWHSSLRFLGLLQLLAKTLNANLQKLPVFGRALGEGHGFADALG